MATCKISPSEHLKYSLRVHSLLPDYELEDAWRFPIVFRQGDTLDQFLALFKSSNDQLMKGGLAGALFKFRMALGKLFRWDDHRMTHDRLIPGSLRHRYAEQEGLTYGELPEPGNGPFFPVYQLENEFLSEIENKTVQAAMHLSRVPLGDGWAVQMAVYVKPKGGLGRFYMLLIKPFRLWIVYPAMMCQARSKWEAYVKAN